MSTDRTNPPAGYEIAEGGNENGHGWFHIPSNVDQIFYATREEAIAAAWAEVEGESK